MAQSQRPTIVHQDELCPPNKRYDLMDANKKVDLENLLCPDERQIFQLPSSTEKYHDLFVPAPQSSLLWCYWFDQTIVADIAEAIFVEELVEDDYNLKRREKGKHVEEIRHTPSPRIQSTLVYSETKKLQELTKIDPTPSSSTPSSSSPKIKLSNNKPNFYLFKSKPRSLMLDS
ncbi:hypothetical protein Tco_0327805 [Tanacetum coccineum]